MKKQSCFMSIGEVAKSLGITRRMILNYEDKGLILPDQKNENTGNRSYSVDTLTRIRTIRVLQTLGLSLDDIHRYYGDETDLQTLIVHLESLRDQLNLNIERLRERVQSDGVFRVENVLIPEQTVYCRTMRAETVEKRKNHLRKLIPSVMRQHGSDPNRQMFFIQHHLDDPELITYCIAVPPGSSGEDICILPEARVLSVFHHGGYDTLPEIEKKIADYAREHRIPLKGICRHIFLEGPAHHKDESKYITQVAALVGKINSIDCDII